MRRPILLATALVAGLVAGLGGALVVVAPAQADAPFTIVVDAGAPIYSSSTITWSGNHDAADPITFALRDDANPDGSSLGSPCTDGTGDGTTVPYTCSYDLSGFPGGVAPGQWELVGSMTTGGGAGLDNESDTFTVVPPATVSVDTSPVQQGGTLQFGGSKASSASIEQFGLLQGEDEVRLNPECAGSDDASTTWSCGAVLDADIATGDWTLQLTIFDEDGRASALTADVEVIPAPGPQIALAFAPASITATATPVDGATDADIRIALQNGSAFETVTTCTAATTCSAGGLAPGLYAIEATSGDAHTAGVYVVVHDAPVVTSAAVVQSDDGFTTSFAGTGVPTDRVTVSDQGGVVCTSGLVGDDGGWTCTTAGGIDDPVTAVQTDTGAGNQSFGVTDGDLPLEYRTGAESAASEPVTPTAPPDAPTISDVTQGLGTSVEISGTSAEGGAVQVREGDTELCTAGASGGDVEGAGFWECSVDAMSPGSHTVTATVIADGGQESLASDPFTFTVVDRPPVSYQVRPGGVTVSEIPVVDEGTDVLELYRWAQGANETWGFGAPLVTCGDGQGEGEGGGTVPAVPATDGTASCSFDLAPGVWNPYNPGLGIDTYLVVPAAPAISLSDNGNSTAHAAGGGMAGDVVTVLDEEGGVLCTATVASDGGWACDTPTLSVGGHSLHAVEQNVTALSCEDGAAIPCPTESGDSEGGEGYRLDYIPGGLSADSAAVPVTIAAIEAPPTPTKPITALTTPVWTFSIDGIDTSNMHPGDTFTASGSGLPAGATVTFVLHSTPVTLGQTVVAQDGTFSFHGTIPLDTEAGAHQIIATLSGTGLVSTTNAKDVSVAAVVPASDDQKDTTDQADTTDGGSASGSGDEHETGIRPEVAPNVLTNGLYSIGDVINHPGKVPAAIAIGLVLLVLGILPAHLLDATLAEQWERVGRRFPRLAKRPGWFERLQAALQRAPAIGGLVVTTVTAVLFCFADPRFGFNLESLRLIIALAVALFVVTYVVDWITKVIVRGAWDVEVTIRLRPLGLVLALLGVIASRALHFSPGFLIGLVLGLSIAGHATGRYAWRAVLIRSGLIIGIALAAWVGFSAFSGEAVEHDFTSALMLELLVAIATEGIVALLIELLPFHLLEGERVFSRSKILWALTYLLTIVVFIVAVVPWEGNWAKLGSGLWSWLGVLIAFAVLALGIYVFFRIRSRREHEVDEDEKADESVAINED